MASAQPLAVAVDLARGGRWTSLRTADEPAVLATVPSAAEQPAPRRREPVDGGAAAQVAPGLESGHQRPQLVEGRPIPPAAGPREWLWRRPAADPDRSAVHPGDAFVDAGGVEECFPTVSGRWDHGDVWTRRWHGTPADAHVHAAGWRLRRRMAAGPEGLLVRYQLTSRHGAGALTEPGVLHAVHGLYALGQHARVVLPDGVAVRMRDVAGDGGWTSTRWPDGLDRCGPEDGTARLAVVATDVVTLVDGPDVLELGWRLDHGEGPVSLLLWRNLGGWPAVAPYRSIGVEPLLGAATDLDSAHPDQLARSGPDGRLGWSLRLSASVR